MLRDSIDYKGTAVGKLFRRFLFPTVMGMVFSAVFVITDGIFVGRGIGSDALAAVNLTAPLFTLGTGLGLMFGMGGSVVASVNLAQGKRRVAQINITQSLFVPALLIVLLSALLILCHKPLLLLLGTPPELMVPAREYLVWFTLFLTPLAVFNILMFIVRLDGAPRFAMACNIMAASINIVLAAGMTFIILTGGIDLSVGSILGTTAVAAMVVSLIPEFAMLSIPAALMLGMVLGLFNGALVAFAGLPPFIVTLGTYTALRGAAYLLADGNLRPCFMLGNKNIA